jgi:hypothetical protein
MNRRRSNPFIKI